MPAPGASWSRSEWLRRLGYKTGDQPPIAHAITPTLGSGDASELLPPLLAAQAWVGTVTFTPTAGTNATMEIHATAPGGAFITWVSSNDSWVLQISPTQLSVWTDQSACPTMTEFGTLETSVRLGNLSAILDGPGFSERLTGGGADDRVSIFVAPGTYAYIMMGSTGSTMLMAAHVRDVPVGLAPD